MVYIISDRKLPRGKISYVTSESKAQKVAKGAEAKTGKHMHIYKVLSPKKKR